ncbi:MAG: hypothetical protein WA071_07660 [Undibacterium umbellatum]
MKGNRFIQSTAFNKQQDRLRTSLERQPGGFQPKARWSASPVE